MGPELHAYSDLGTASPSDQNAASVLSATAPVSYTEPQSIWRPACRSCDTGKALAYRI